MPHPMGRILGVIFDMDGTLTLPGAIDFAAMRSRVGAPRGVDVLEHIATHEDADERARLHSILEDEEETGFRRQELMPDARTALDALVLRGLRLAVLTRNNENVMARTLAMLERPGMFSPTLSRSFLPSKPHPAPIHHICGVWSCSPQDVVIVGDSRDDVLCGRAAGVRTVIVGEPGQHGHDEAAALADAGVRTLTDAIALLEVWGLGPLGHDLAPPVEARDCHAS